AKYEDDSALPGRGPLLEGLSAECISHSLRNELAHHEPIDGVEHLSGAVAGLGNSSNQRGGEAVEPGHQTRTTLEPGADQRRNRDHCTVSTLYIKPPDILRLFPELSLRLGLNPVRLAVQVEVIDVQRGEEGLQGLEEVCERNPECLGL